MAGRVRLLTSNPSNSGTQRLQDAVMRCFCEGGEANEGTVCLKIGTHLVSVAPKRGRVESSFISAAAPSATASPS